MDASGPSASPAPPPRLSGSARRAHKRSAEAAWERCTFYLVHKKRHCTMWRSPGLLFCGNHMPMEGADASRRRMVCPVDASHTLYVSDLASHVAVCNASKRAAARKAMPCFSPACNAGPPLSARDAAALLAFHACAAGVGGESSSGVGGGGIPGGGEEAERAAEAAGAAAASSLLRRLLHGTPPALDLPTFAARVAALHAEHVGALPLTPASSAPGDALIAAATIAAKGVEGGTLRHARQQASIVGHMAAAGLLRVGAAVVGGEVLRSGMAPPLLLVEFGAGRGQLSSVVDAFVSAEVGAQARIGSESCRADVPSAREGLAPDGLASAGGVPHSRGGPFRYVLIDRGAARRKWNGRGASHAAADVASAPAAAAAASDELASSPPTASGSAAPVSAPVAGADTAPVPSAASIDRLRMDIADFDLSRYVASTAAAAAAVGHSAALGGASAGEVTAADADEAVPRVVAYGKHLCGAATDLTLRCLAHGVGWREGVGAARAGGAVDLEAGAAIAAGSASASADALGARADSAASAAACPPRPLLRLHGVAIATCCHHVCSWEHYVGRAWFEEALHCGAREFEAMRLLSSWALNAPSEPPAGAGPGLDCALLGRQCKRLIDAGRAAFLKQVTRGGGRLLTYCRVDESPENCLLLGGAWE